MTTKDLTETRKGFFEMAENAGVFYLDFGTRGKIASNGYSKSVRFVIALMQELASNNDRRVVPLSQIQKAWKTEILNAKKEYNTLKDKKERTESDKARIKELEPITKLIQKGKIQSGAIIGKQELKQAAKAVYLMDKQLFSVTFDSDVSASIKLQDYIPNLFRDVTNN